MLTEAASYAKAKRVRLLIETVPVPEFGDVSPQAKASNLRDLRNPWYLAGDWGFEQIKQTGIGICVDLCHTKTIYDAATIGDPEGLLYKEDVRLLSKRSLKDDIAALQMTDLCHLNDGRGRFTNAGESFEEGVVLGDGEIHDLKQIMTDLKQKKIPVVLEINESDYENRPNLLKSLSFLKIIC